MLAALIRTAHEAKLNGVLIIEQGMIGAGSTSQSSGLLRMHYSVRQNVELARASRWAFNNFADYLGDDEASCGFVGQRAGFQRCTPTPRDAFPYGLTRPRRGLALH
ncbi:glycine/D-amino acid oxidase-like deaminating enzyme [Paraburkholderia sp. MM5477-R1]